LFNLNEISLNRGVEAVESGAALVASIPAFIVVSLILLDFVT